MAAKLWWIMQKDLTCEYRARRAWPAMVLLGGLVAMLFGLQMDLPGEGKRRIVGSLLWLATVLAGSQFYAGLQIANRAVVVLQLDVSPRPFQQCVGLSRFIIERT